MLILLVGILKNLGYSWMMPTTAYQNWQANFLAQISAAVGWPKFWLEYVRETPVVPWATKMLATYQTRERRFGMTNILVW
jgi:hypothetical protein